MEAEQDQYYLSPIANPIANPLANGTLTHKILKLIRHLNREKQLKRGVKDVVKVIKKGVKGIVILAADVSPIDVISHIPVLCEDHGIPYIFVASRMQLGTAAETKKPTSVVLMIGSEKEEIEEKYGKLFGKIVKSHPYL